MLLTTQYFFIMQPRSEKQQQAQDLFLNTEKSRQEIADILNIDRKTLYLWIKNGRWEQMKETAMQAPEVIIDNLYSHISEINNGIRNRPEGQRAPTPQEVNMLHKLLKMTNEISRRERGWYMSAFMELMKFINKKDYKLARTVLPVVDEFVKGMMRDSETKYEDSQNAFVREVVENLAADEKEAEELKLQVDAIEQAMKTVTGKTGTEQATPDAPSAATTPAMGHNGAMPVAPAETTKPAPANDSSDLSAPEIPQNSEEKIKMGNGASAPSGNPTGPVKDAAWYATLPPSQRPSPFREGNIIWVNHIDDIKDSERKMSETVHLYSELEKGNQQNPGS